MLYEAHELECVTGNHDKFYRIIRYGGTLVIRFGKRGSQGQRLVETLTAHDAAEKLSDLVYLKQENKDYYTVRRSFETPECPGLRPSADDLEGHFLATWHATSPVVKPELLYGDDSSWAVLSTVLKMSKTGPFGRFVLEDAALVPHAIDEQRDLLLVPTRSCIIDDDLNYKYLGPVRKEHALDLLPRVLNLYYEGHPCPTELFAAAKTLAGAK